MIDKYETSWFQSGLADGGRGARGGGDYASVASKRGADDPERDKGASSEVPAKLTRLHQTEPQSPAY